MRKLLIPRIEKVGGTTLRATWFVEDSVANPIISRLYNGSGDLVGSAAGVSSGGGYYYALHLLPSSAQWLRNDWIATISANTYRAVQLVHVLMPEVD